MGMHHIALATRDMRATHQFYTEAMGFKLVKVLDVSLPGSKGESWARHAFYRVSRKSCAMITFWDVHGRAQDIPRATDISTGLGLPLWMNHLAFDAPTLGDLAAGRARWRELGLTLTEMDHGFCRSIYTVDPNGIMVEFCHDTRALTEEDAAEAERSIFAQTPTLEDSPDAASILQ